MKSYTSTRLICVLIISCSLLVSSAVAQDSSKVKPQEKRELFKTHPSSVQPATRQPAKKPTTIRGNRPVPKDRRFQLAQQLVSQRNYENAAQILESLLDEQPNNANAQNLALSCYTRLNQHLKAERLLRQMIERHPTYLMLRLNLAEQLIKLGEQEAGQEAYAAAIKLVDSTNPGQFDLVLRSMVTNNQDDAALTLIDSLRVSEANPLLFADRRGAVLEKRRDFAEAAREYYSVLDQDTTRTALQAERRLLALLTFAEATEVVETALLEQVIAGDNMRVLNLLIGHYMNTGGFDEAFQLAIHQDSITERGGSRLSQFLFQATNYQEYDQVIRMGEYITEHYSDSPIMTEATIRYANALRKTGRQPEALAAIGSIAAKENNPSMISDLLYKMGEIYMEDLKLYDSALIYFDSVSHYYPRGLGSLRARRAIPVCYFRKGEMAEATKAFDLLARQLQNEAGTEQYQFYQALLSLAAQNYDSTTVALTRLSLEHVDGFYVNDGIELTLVLKETENSPELRDKISEAFILEHRFQLDSAQIVYQSLAEAEDSSMADLALYRLSQIALTMDRQEAAMLYAEQLLTRFEESYYYPLALRVKADILISENNEAGQEEAGQLYRRILSEFPNYPFVTQVRQALRELEAQLEPTEAAGRS